MKKPIEKIIKMINFSLKVDANSTSTSIIFQPKAPKQLERYKYKND